MAVDWPLLSSLGAQGMDIGTRFFGLDGSTHQCGVAAGDSGSGIRGSDQGGGVERFLGSVRVGHGTVPRALSSPFIEQWQHRRDDAEAGEAERLRGEVMAAIRQGWLEDWSCQRGAERRPNPGQSSLQPKLSAASLWRQRKR